MILRTAHITGILERDPRVPGFEENLEHLLPQIDRRHPLAPDLALIHHLLVGNIAFLERGTVEVVQVRNFVGTEKRPLLAGFHPLHEQVGNPVRRVHVVGSAAVVTGILPQLEKIEDVVVPCLQIGTTRAATFPSLIDGNELVVVQLEERNYSLTLTVGAFDVASRTTNGGPGSAKATRPFAEKCVFGNAAQHDALDAVVDFVEVAA